MVSGKNAKKRRPQAPVAIRRQGAALVDHRGRGSGVGPRRRDLRRCPGQDQRHNSRGTSDDRVDAIGRQPRSIHRHPRHLRWRGHPARRGHPGRLRRLQGRVPRHRGAAGRLRQIPPVGGPHDGTWANCNGIVYTTAVRDENMVHTLEHGAVWITYNPDTITQPDLTTLTAAVDGQPYLSLSPRPDLERPISLQAWAHQLKLDSATDERVEQFIAALRQNPWVTPETGATCQQPTFDTTNPPPFDPTPPGADAVPMSGPSTATTPTAGATVLPGGAETRCQRRSPTFTPRPRVVMRTTTISHPAGQPDSGLRHRRRAATAHGTPVTGTGPPAPTARRPTGRRTLILTVLALLVVATAAGVLAEQAPRRRTRPLDRAAAAATDLQPGRLVQLRQHPAGAADHRGHRRRHPRGRGLRLANGAHHTHDRTARIGRDPGRRPGQPHRPRHRRRGHRLPAYRLVSHLQPARRLHHHRCGHARRRSPLGQTASAGRMTHPARRSAQLFHRRQASQGCHS